MPGVVAPPPLAAETDLSAAGSGSYNIF